MKLGKITYSSIRLSEYVQGLFEMSLSITSFFFYNNRSYTDKVIIYMMIVMSFSRVYFDFERSCETLMYVARSCLFMYNITENGGKTP